MRFRKIVSGAWLRTQSYCSCHPEKKDILCVNPGLADRPGNTASLPSTVSWPVEGCWHIFHVRDVWASVPAELSEGQEPPPHTPRSAPSLLNISLRQPFFSASRGAILREKHKPSLENFKFSWENQILAQFLSEALGARCVTEFRIVWMLGLL